MEHRQLHPNLARLAATYDDILEQFTRNQLSPEEARFRVSSLTARDDQGVQWCINPDDGQWYRMTVQGRLVRDVPPEAGVATYTGWDLSGGDPMADPRNRVIDSVVDPRELSQSTQLTGATARFVRNEADERASQRPAPRRWLLIAAAVLAMFVVVGLWMSSRHSPSAPAPTPVQVTSTAPPLPGQ